MISRGFEMKIFTRGMTSRALERERERSNGIIRQKIVQMMAIADLS